MSSGKCAAVKSRSRTRNGGRRMAARIHRDLPISRLIAAKIESARSGRCGCAAAASSPPNSREVSARRAAHAQTELEPHASQRVADSKLQRKLTRKTLAARRKGGRRKILLDHLIEEAEGRPIPEKDLEKVKTRIAQELRRISFAR